MYFDSHAHLDDKKFNADREHVIETLLDQEISGVLNVCSCLQNIEACIELAQRYGFIYAAVGVHPHEAAAATNEDLANIIKAAGHIRVKAYGEIGLDYYYDFSPRDVQRKLFADQIDIACEMGLPIVVHNRDAHKDVLDIIRASKNKLHGGVMHCYSGSWETAKLFMDAGMQISLGGTVTFKNAIKPLEVAEKIPLDRLLIETDSPYLAPHPYRGNRNHPGHVKLVARKIADIRGISCEEVAETTCKNAKKLLGLEIYSQAAPTAGI